MFHRFHKRAPSNPTSPLPDQLASWESAAIHEHPHTAQDVLPRPPDMRPRSSNAANTLPFLPPIARVSSAEADGTLEPPRDPGAHHAARDSRSPPPPAKSPHNAGDTGGFIGGAAFRNFRWAAAQDAAAGGGMQPPGGVPAGGLPESSLSRSKPPPPPINTSFLTRPPPVPTKDKKPASSFVTPTDLQSSSVMGKRPAGARLVSDPLGLATSHNVPDTHKARKGLPFLKNPMSTLLNRRKTGQTVQDVLPVPVAPDDEPVYAPIRGTRVHDFSAPRPRRLVSSGLAAGGAAGGPAAAQLERRVTALGNGAAASQDALAEEQRPRTSGAGRPNSESESLSLEKKVSEPTLYDQKRASLNEKPLPAQPVPPVPPKDGPGSPTTSASTRSQRISINASSIPEGSPVSTTAGRSRNVSLSGVSTKDAVMSSLPKHMKSTSSRFSFMVGTASQERLLEERHRQKQMEKKAAGSGAAPRQSLYDEFDEDNFDYDAMMDDDGLEERIPGINADADEEDYMEEEIPTTEDYDEDAELDPDNDQENFAGFVFQRSNQASTLPTPLSPGMMATPRDATGKVIGFAVTKDGTPDLHQPPSANSLGPMVDPSMVSKSEDNTAGLGIQGLDVEQPSETQNPEDDQQNGQLPDLMPNGFPRTIADDDLYFDQGLIDELNFSGPQENVPFDESIFDYNDTDMYGRPIPGAFARAQAMRAAAAGGALAGVPSATQDASQDTTKRESDDITSRLSGQSQLSQSTAHTSLSVGLLGIPPSADEFKSHSESISPGQELPPALRAAQIAEQERIVAYQAALAEAAHKAAASGKFRRDSSPPPVADLTLTSPTAESETRSTHSQPEDALDDYERDDFTQGLDDYGFEDDDFGDDDIIAEANASALANDKDGWYGQEFGFYSAPPTHYGYGPMVSAPSVPKSSGTAPLSAQNLYEYASGGYFGPSGLGRTTSGRVVSREPNLTPITERSEYSNRNSIMSLAVPPIGSSADLRSPGLAQLAMMTDDSDINLEAFMRLRNKAFGGSQVSLTGSSKEGSPKSTSGDRDGATSPWGGGMPPAGYFNLREGSVGSGGHVRKNSATAFSVRSADSDAGSGTGSPTLTMMSFPAVPAPAPLFTGAAPTPPPPAPRQISPGVAASPSCPPVLEEGDEAQALSGDVTGASSVSGSGLWVKSPSASSGQSGHSSVASPNLALASPTSSSLPRRPGMGHRHKGSADSISYTKEKEEDSGETRWVMERRRMAETGEVEILEREVVEGGRI